MGLKAKAKSRHRALVKVVLFIVRVQKSQKKRQEQREHSEERRSKRSNVIPLLRCSTVPTLPVIGPGPLDVTDERSAHDLSMSPSHSNTLDSGDGGNSPFRFPPHRSPRDWHNLKVPNKYASFLSVCDDEEKGHLSVCSGSNASSYSRSRASSSVSRTSGGADSLSSAGGCDDDGPDADRCAGRPLPTFVDFTSMNKPYTLSGCGELMTNGTIPGPRPSVKGITVTCNSVMRDPRKLSKQLIRRGSTLDGRDERFTFRPSTSCAVIASGNSAYGNHNQQRQKKSNGSGKAPMIRQRTADGGGNVTCVRPTLHRCTSDENVPAVVVAFENDPSPQTTKKFVKRKSSADLLMTSCDASSGTLSTSTLERISGLATGVMSKSLAVTQMNKAEKKKLQKKKENVKQLMELFTAVEQDDIGKVRSILHHGEVDINESNPDELTALDVATMLNHTEVSLVLLKHGAQENQKLSNLNYRMKHLQGLIDCAQKNLEEFTLAAAKQSGSSISASGSAGTLSKTLDKQISNWESRLHTLNKMWKNLETSDLPTPPKAVVLTVTSSTSLLVSFEPQEQQAGVTVTKYKVEWSQHEEFSDLLGSICVYDLRRLESTITNLTSGSKYYVRVCAGTYKGFGSTCNSQPTFAVPSSWRDIDQTRERGAGRLEVITELYHEVRKLKKTDLWERIAYTGVDVALKRKKHSTATLKNLFSSSVKFQRNLKRGVYLASILYKDDKVLCTVDDTLPVVEIDETVPGSLGPDFQWLMKLSCAWEDMKCLHFDAELANQSPSLIFRLKLLAAASAMQAYLGVQDLGRLHSTPIIDSKGVTVLVTVQYVHDSKSVQGLAVKWMHMNKLLRKQSACHEKDLSAMDLLVGSLLNFLNFYESTYIPLDRGLYLGYVKLHTSINQISIVVPETLPSVLPFVFIRPNPHVSKEEWEWLRIVDTDAAKHVLPSACQLAFHQSIAAAARVLLNDLDVGDDQIHSHRIYRLEVVEIHSDVSFILLVPSHDDVCLPPGQPRILAEERRGCIALPVPMFEVAHLCTYQPDFIALYCRLSVFLEFYSVVLQQLHRQTLNEDEAKTYRQLLDTLSCHQQRLEDVWKAARWITAVVTAARDRQLRSSLSLSVLLAYNRSGYTSLPDLSKCISNDGFPTAMDGTPVTSFRRQSSDTDAVAVKSRLGSMGDARGSRTTDHQSTSAAASSLQRNVSSGEQSFSEEVGEENSDVGYHSDQSVEKLVNGAVAEARSCQDHGLNSVPAAASNPTYDFPERLFQGNSDANGSDGPNQEGNERTLLTAGNMEYVVNKLNLVQRTIPDSNSKLVAARYGKYSTGAQLTSNTGSVRLTKQSSLTSPPATYRTEILIGESSDEGRSNKFSSPLVNQRGTHDYVNVDERFTSSVALPRRKSGSVLVPSNISASSDSEACASTSTTSSSQSRLRQQADAMWLSNDMNNRVVEDLSVIDKLYVEATARSSVYPVARIPLTALNMASSPRPPSSAGSTRSVASSSSDRSRGTIRVQSPQSGLLRVYAAYPCGLAKGTSVKLHITPKTTAREVVVLVVRQLSKAAETKALKGPIYEDEQLTDFVLVAVIGARERCLRDDFSPLELQNPWCKGKLFVRRKNDLLAALEFGNEAKV